MSKIAFSGLTCFSVKLKVSRSELSKDLHYLVLESNQSDGYYAKQDFPPNKLEDKDHHLFLLVKNNVICFQDIVLRHAALVSEKIDVNLHIAPGQMTYQNKSYQGIRINTKHTKYLSKVIEYAKELGIELLEDNKKLEPYVSLVYFKKYVEFEEIMDGVYKDVETSGRYFFKIPRPLEFEEFEQKIDTIKNNCNFRLFDSFLNHLFVKGKVVDFVGIYSQHCEEDRFGEFKMHLEKIFQ
jgi:hypothetical protein